MWSYIGIEVRQNYCANKLRALAGLHNPDIAKSLRPNEIRAKFDTNCVMIFIVLILKKMLILNVIIFLKSALI